MPKLRPVHDAHPRSIEVNVNLVLVPVNVVDSLHHPVLDLQRQDFELYEGNDPQQIRYFFREDAPISVALVLDISGSMRNQIDLLREAMDEFFANANPQDDYTVVAVSDRPEVLMRGTRSIDDIRATLATVKPAGWTALLDSVRVAAMSLKTARYQRRLILIVSDGMDNNSRHSLREVANLVEESDLDAYAIGVMNDAPPIVGALMQRIDRKLLMRITDVTGGRTVVLEHSAEIPRVAAKLSEEMRSQYVLGYRPTDGAHDRRWRKISVTVTAPGEAYLRAYYKKSYFTPGD
jgi:Ca-activated chloride channel family protein